MACGYGRGLRVDAAGDVVAQPRPGVGRGLDGHRGGDHAGLVAERREPLSPPRDPDVDLLLVDERGAVGLAGEHDGVVVAGRHAQQRERPVIAVVGLAQRRGREQPGQLVGAPRREPGRARAVEVGAAHPRADPPAAQGDVLQPGLAVPVADEQRAEHSSERHEDDQAGDQAEDRRGQDHGDQPDQQDDRAQRAELADAS